MVAGCDTAVPIKLCPEMADHPGVGRGASKEDKTRKYIYLHGFGDSTKLFCHNNSKANLVRAIHERVFRVKGEEGLQLPPRPAPGVFTSRLTSVREAFERLLSDNYVPLSDKQFLSQVPAPKRKIYESAIRKWYKSGLHKGMCGVSAFVKFEKQVEDEEKPDPAPRVIQTRSPVYHYRAGRYTRVIEHDIYKTIEEIWGGPTVMKGMNPDQVAGAIVTAWESFSKPIGIGLDASRFDQHVSRDALIWEHGIYTRCFKDNAELRWLMKQQLENVGYGDYPGGQIRYKTDGCRMSGDMNTGLGNCLLMCAMMKAYVDGLGVKARLINNGDDCVLIVEEADLDVVMNSYKQWFLEMGFKMTLEGGDIARRLEQIIFCQLQLVFTGEHGWTMVRQLKAVVKDAACLTPDLAGIPTWMGAVGECGLALAGDIPVYGAIYRAYQRMGNCSKRNGNQQRITVGHAAFRNTGMALASRGMNRGAHGTPTDEARASFYLAFGIEPVLQRCLEQRFDTIERTQDRVSGFSLHDLLPRE